MLFLLLQQLPYRNRQMVSDGRESSMWGKQRQHCPIACKLQDNFSQQLSLHHTRRAVRSLVSRERVHNVARVGGHRRVAAILLRTTKSSHIR